MTRISYDIQAQCWREDPNGTHWGVWHEDGGWKPIWKTGDYHQENPNA